MKTLLSVALSSVMIVSVIPSAFAADTQKVTRNDRVSVSKGIPQYDINPFVDNKRAVRNDRVSHSSSKVQKQDEKQAVKKERIVRNDRVVLSKVVAVS
ncbi:hypothetical protein [Acinetobacter sp. KS-LM10]|uniref:hypothetical protein n=1 Tax=Acinetobacter sp. KS-LM10 TaxID=3120518 RepID=UPI0030CBF79E